MSPKHHLFRNQTQTRGLGRARSARLPRAGWLPALAALLLCIADASAQYSLTANDASGSTSWNTAGHWSSGAAPAPGNTYSTANFGMRTPPVSGNQTFLGDSLTVAVGGSVGYKGTGAHDIISANWIMAGGDIGNAEGNPPTYNPIIGGTMNVTAPSALDPDAAGRVFVLAATLSGSALLTNGFGFAGLFYYTNDNATAFTGSLQIDSGATLYCNSQTNLGGNPPSFGAAQLIFNKGILQPLTSFALNNANSGVTLYAGGGSFNVASGLTLTIANPITGPGALTNVSAGTLMVSGTNTYTGATVINAGTLWVNGTNTVGSGTTGTYLIRSGATLGGSGWIDLSAVNLGVTLASGAKLSPGAATNTAGTLTLNLGTGTLDISGAVASSALLFDLGATNASDQVVLPSGTLNLGSGVLNIGSFVFNALGGLQAGTYTLFQAPAITGTLGTSLTGEVGGYNATLALNGGNLQLTLTVPAQPLPVFSQLTPSQSIKPAISSLTLTGNLAAIGPTYPPTGEPGTVSATIDGVNFPGTFTDAVGDFSITVNTTLIPLSSAPYTIFYSYAGDAHLGAANNNSTTLTIQAPIVLGANDASGSSSFNTVGNWVLYGTTTPASSAPSAGNYYNTFGLGLRTPAAAGKFTFGGDSLTIAAGSIVGYKGTGSNDIISANWIMAGGVIQNSEGTPPTLFPAIAGTMNVISNSALSTTGPDYRYLVLSATLSGSALLTNGFSGYAGAIYYTNDNATAFTGPLLINGGLTLICNSQTNLGGNPPSFNAAQLTLDNGTLQAAASFALSNANSGITITPNGGTLNVPAGVTLTINNPLTDSAAGPGPLASTNGGQVVLNGNNSGFSGGVSVLNGNTLDLTGTLGCGLTSDSTSTIEGPGTATGTLDVSGTLIAGTATTAGTLTVGGLILENGATLAGNLTSATTVGAGVNSFFQVSGPVTLNNNNIVIHPHGTLAVGNTYTLLACTGAITGSFIPVATTPNSQYSFSVSQVTSGASTLIQLTVTAEQNCLLTASDSPSSSSWNTAGNWSCGAAPGPGATYSTASFALNTPAASGTQVFAGDLLTIAHGGSVIYAGSGAGDVISANWILNGGAIVIGTAGGGSTPTIAGNLTLVGAGAINPGAGGTVTIAATLAGTNLLTNGLGQAGTVIYTTDDATAFTGPMLVNGGTMLQCGSQANLGGNPPSFNAAQLTFDNGIFQPEASFALNNTNSGITITTHGGTIDVPNGLTLTLDNPLTGAGVLTNTDSGMLVLNSGTNGLAGGLLVVNGATLELNGSIACGITNDSSSTVEGSGTAVGTLDVSGALMAGTATTAGTWTVGGLVLENGATLTASLFSTTTVGQGTNSFIQVNGNLTLNNNTINLNLLWPLTVGNTYTLLACTGTVSGSFAPLITLPTRATFNVATVATSSNTLVQVTFTKEGADVMDANDALGTTSWNTGLDWTLGVAPAGGSAYSTAGFNLRTPQGLNSTPPNAPCTFAGDSLTIAPGGALALKGGGPSDVYSANWIMAGGNIGNALGGNYPVLAGTMNVSAPSALDPDVTGRSLIVSATLSGSALLTNGLGIAGLFYYTNDDATAFTGPMLINGGSTLICNSQTNLGGNPPSFNAAQLILDGSILQPASSFALNNANSGLTITPNGGTIDVPAGLTLTIDNPLAGAAPLTITDSGAVVLSSSSSGFTTGLLVENGATLVLNGSVGCTIANDPTSTLAGTGTAAGTLTMAGNLVGGTATTAGTLAAGGLVLQSGANLIADLTSATTVGQGVNSFIQVNGNLTLNSNTITINPLGPLAVGNTYTLLACTGVFSGVFASAATAASTSYRFSVTNVVTTSNTLVQLTVTAAPAVALPAFNQLTFTSGSLVMSGTNGVANQTYYLLTTTNLATPLTNWVVLSTNSFDVNGNFALTNPVASGTPQRFFKLLTP